MVVLHYYTRPGCHLCEIMLEELLLHLRGKAELEMRDVDNNPEWLEKYGNEIPVVEAGGQVLTRYPMNPEAVRQFLAGIDESGHEISE